MSLKDANSYNVQFRGSQPVFIDTLSFEGYEEGEPWVAYEQFCRHFLGPLAIMAFNDIGLSHILQVYLDGIPIYTVKSMLPLSSMIRPSIAIHVFLQDISAKKADQSLKYMRSRKFSRRAMMGLIGSLRAAIGRLEPAKSNSYKWNQYYTRSIGSQYLQEKQRIVSDLLRAVAPDRVVDFGANVGLLDYSAVLSNTSLVLSIDKDPSCVEHNYNQYKSDKAGVVLPLVMDFNCPSPSIGWDNQERMGFFERAVPDTVMILALMHHLTIGNNVSLEKLAIFLAKHFKKVIIEFVPFDDPNVEKLITLRRTTNLRYTRSEFCTEFDRFFLLQSHFRLETSNRELFFFLRR
jgi:hypothetical protein